MTESNLTDSKEFSKLAEHAFTPIYPYLAQQIKDKFKITEGTCVDIGSGPGHLAIAMAKITNLHVVSLDIQPDMTAIAQTNINMASLSQRIRTVTADVCHMPFEDNSVELVISRGSIFFWSDRPAGCTEIHRILKPGGVAYCGGSMGNSKIKAQVMENIRKNEVFGDDKELWTKRIGTASSRLDSNALINTLAESGIRATAETGNEGIWIQIIK